jgi:uncharacterized protein
VARLSATCYVTRHETREYTKLVHRWDVAVILRVKVKPNSHGSCLAQEADGSWRAQLKAPPIDGKANAELITLIAKHFKCRKADVAIKSGASGRIKLIRVDGQ